MNKLIALIEIGGSHDECLFSQVAYLQNRNIQIILICSENLRSQVSHYRHHFKDIIFLPFGKSWLQNLKSLLLIRRIIQKEKIRKVVFNTASGKLIRNIVFMLPSKTDLIGIIHNLGKLHKSKTQRLISKKIKKYFVLNDFLKKEGSGTNLTIESFYPIVYPDYTSNHIQKSSSDFWICIPGHVETVRRDYLGLLQHIDESRLFPNITFILLGRMNVLEDKLRILDMIQKKNLSKNFIYFEDFVPNEVFFSYLKKSDILMPLIHPGIKDFSSYQNHKISGAYNLAFGHQKAMLKHESFNHIDIFKQTSIFYSLEKITEKINEVSMKTNKLLQHIENDYKNIKEFSFDYQSKKYFRFICGKG